ncbi:MAG: phosphomannomutase [Candidatus Doudnabacteria bacterium CG10_big_fil_rev_8_21_14_0_10_42_18]|uniref:Phosphomannomutase n=1 Tax=Candidatus Doudnabacteria bacterium CG10_big_fil_rev_8_21_14_0_10_42_18 TaxID=1974552 RepID=A0A2H0VBC4_9BACT|nr:MAG: phosphomannomutase [Candidatus Doudnabacteria bacterium CG10_big_fil_rev_8_21_14_0_10_42_18]
MNNIDPAIFKAYDIRGKYPSQINAEVVYAIARAYAEFIKPKNVVVGTDMRLCGEEFKQALIKALTDAGADVIDVGLVSTDQFYFAAYHLGAGGGIMATASHNPKEYGGLKLVREKAMPISGDSGIYKIRDLVLSSKYQVSGTGQGKVKKTNILDAYYEHVLSKFDVSKFKDLKVVANTNFGMATPAVEELKKRVPSINFLEVINGRLDGSFPKGRPDPLRPETREETSQTIKKLKPDLGVAWDGDADRCFFFDEKGEFVTPAYINALLSEYYLQKFPGGKILRDTRVYRVIDDAINRGGGISVPAVAGHSFIKERMIKEDAVFGTETSGHYYFKENFYLDNGLLPFLAVLDILSSADKTFSELLAPLREKFFISEEINFKFENQNILEDIKKHYLQAEIGELDGLDVKFDDWRASFRKSNTENYLRVNLEANSKELLEIKIKEVTSLISGLSS